MRHAMHSPIVKKTHICSPNYFFSAETFRCEIGSPVSRMTPGSQLYVLTMIL